MATIPVYMNPGALYGEGEPWDQSHEYFRNADKWDTLEGWDSYVNPDTYFAQQLGVQPLPSFDIWDAAARAKGMTPLQSRQAWINAGLGARVWNEDSYRAAAQAIGGFAAGSPRAEAIAGQGADFYNQQAEHEKQVDKAGKTTLGDVLKGALFALSPIGIGAGLTGVSTATALGGGLGADVIGAIVNPAGAMGLSGPTASLANNVLKQGLNYGINKLDEQPNVTSFVPRAATAQPTAVASQQTASLGDSVLSQDAPSISSPTSLSNSVMSVSQPRNVVRRPQIRLTPGFRRGY